MIEEITIRDLGVIVQYEWARREVVVHARSSNREQPRDGLRLGRVIARAIPQRSQHHLACDILRIRASPDAVSDVGQVNPQEVVLVSDVTLRNSEYMLQQY